MVLSFPSFRFLQCLSFRYRNKSKLSNVVSPTEAYYNLVLYPFALSLSLLLALHDPAIHCLEHFSISWKDLSSSLFRVLAYRLFLLLRTLLPSLSLYFS